MNDNNWQEEQRDQGDQPEYTECDICKMTVRADANICPNAELNTTPRRNGTYNSAIWFSSPSLVLSWQRRLFATELRTRFGCSKGHWPKGHKAPYSSVKMSGGELLHRVHVNCHPA